MLEIEIDGKQLQVAEGSTVMDAAHKIGAYIPHFCYHKKLSIAANCRMCLVSVEKAPKPLPACATPVSNGLKVQTRDTAAVKAQQGVMEFLLINHPLDCPICDQGGECQLQDLSVGYGGSASRFMEEKRVVMNKDLGPLVSTDMTRCIHCTRCVRFGQEIAGIMELGQAGRGEKSEIMAFVGRTVDSELSGNVIDLCPVGALTSKPFRFSARTWELNRRKSVSPHDSLGANLIVQTKHDVVKRVLPLENEEVNECWLSDKDRFSYEGLYAEDRLTRPMLKHDGRWHEVGWQVALDYVVRTLKGVTDNSGAESIGALASPHSTVEELHLLQKLVRGLGSGNVDFRLRTSDFSLDKQREGAPWLGMKIAEIAGLDRVLVVGSFLRKDHPLICQRLRQSAKRGMQLSMIHPTADDLAMPVRARVLVGPQGMARTLAQVLLALAEKKGVLPSEQLGGGLVGLNVDAGAMAIADSLASGGNVSVFLGNLAQQHPDAATLHVLAQEIARIAGGRLGVLGEAANSVGGYIANALPSGLNAAEMLAQPRQAYLLLNVEPELDCHNSAQAMSAMAAAKSVIVLSAFKGQAADYADCLLPIAPFAETSGTFVNTEGRAQRFNAVVKPSGDARPAWKVLRVLGNMFDLSGFDQESSEAVYAEVVAERSEFVAGLDNTVSLRKVDMAVAPGMYRVADVPIHFADALVRRAPSLQSSTDAAAPSARMNATTASALNVTAGDSIRLRQGEDEATLIVRVDDGVADHCLRVAAAHPTTAGLGAMFGGIQGERA